jgi:branched-chain amino acid transport system permease protein
LTLYLTILSSGIVIGSLYGLLGLGITFVLRVTKVLNLSHGAVAAFCGLAYAWCLKAGVPAYAALVAVVALGFAIGFAQGAFLRPWLEAGRGVIAVFVTLALGILVEGVALLLFGKDTMGATPFVRLPDLRFGGAVLTGAQLLLLAITLLGSAAFAVWYFRAASGKVYRALVDDELGAAVIGVAIGRLRNLAFAIGGSAAAIAGIAVTPLLSVSYSSGHLMLVNGLTAAILGGVSNPFGALAGGMLVGIIQASVTGLISTLLMLPASLALLLLVLIIRPDGLLPSRLRHRTI